MCKLVLSVLQSPSQHTHFPTPRSVGELEGTNLEAQMDFLVGPALTAPTSMVYWCPMAVQGTTSGLLLLEYQKMTTRLLAATAPVHSIPIKMCLHLWERATFANLRSLDNGKSSGTLMTLCGTHRGV